MDHRPLPLTGRNAEAQIIPLYADFLCGGGSYPLQDIHNIHASIKKKSKLDKNNCVSKSIITIVKSIIHFILTHPATDIFFF